MSRDFDGLSTRPTTLGQLPTGARLIIRCRADWREACVAEKEPKLVTLVVNAPSGRAYRIRRAVDLALSYDGEVPVLGEGEWRVNLVRADLRW
ncbi:MAG: hypothetical protein C4334_03580 [Pyrinomonas sp.]